MKNIKHGDNMKKGSNPPAPTDIQRPAPPPGPPNVEVRQWYFSTSSTNERIKMNKMILVLGDWSDDGHGICRNILVEVNKDVADVRQAYKDSCKLTTISFNNQPNFTGITTRDNQYITEPKPKVNDIVGVDVDDDIPLIQSLQSTIYTKNEQYQIATLYQDCMLMEQCVQILQKFNCPVLEKISNCGYLSEELFIELWFWFVSLSLPDLQWKLAPVKYPIINGPDTELPVQLGYGLYE
jgi:hypothetical protein